MTMGVLGALCGVGPAGAQTVRGTLVEAGTNRPIPGAFVILEDPTGQAISTTLTEARARGFSGPR